MVSTSNDSQPCNVSSKRKFESFHQPKIEQGKFRFELLENFRIYKQTPQCDAVVNTTHDSARLSIENVVDEGAGLDGKSYTQKREQP